MSLGGGVTCACRYTAHCAASQGGLRARQAHDVQELRAITTKHHLASSQFAASILGTRGGGGGGAPSKQVVRLSGYSHELLMHFLHGAGARMLPLLSNINQFFDFKVGGVGAVGAG